MKLTHPQSDHVIEPGPEHRDMYLSEGWVPENEKPEK